MIVPSFEQREFRHAPRGAEAARRGLRPRELRSGARHDRRARRAQRPRGGSEGARRRDPAHSRRCVLPSYRGARFFAKTKFNAIQECYRAL